MSHEETLIKEEQRLYTSEVVEVEEALSTLEVT